MGPMKLLSRGENSLMSIPIDLIIDIFLRLPAKSIARCCCVSKHWASFIRHQDFRELFLTRSSSQLLFACQIKNKLYFFSAHQPQNPDQEKNSCVVIEANHLARFHCDSHSESEVFAPVSGFSCLFLRDERIVNINVCRKSLWAICNPSTGEYFPLPKGITKRKIGVRSYIGYDHIKKQFKVLSMTWSLKRRARSEEHQVMTLGTDQPSWKMVECCIPHVPGEDNGICINGVLYYKAKDYNSSEESMIVCFDVSSEKFRVLKVEEPFSGDMFHKPTLIIYNGKLGLLLQDTPFYICGRSRSFELWVLEDEGKQEWSKHVHVLPTSWEKVVGKAELYFVGMNGTNEFVLSPHSLSMPCHIFYYNTERKTITRVVIQGLEAFNGCGFRTFLNYADNMMLIQGM